MRLTKRYAAPFAALILALGLVALPREGAAGENDDVVLLPRPSGDPDTGGPSRFSALNWSSWVGASARSLSFLRISPVRRAVVSRPQASIRSQQTAAVRR